MAEYEKGDRVRIHDGTEVFEGLEGKVYKVLTNDGLIQVDLDNQGGKPIFLREKVKLVDQE